MEIDNITEQVIGAAIEVHRILGPGLLESAYEACLCHELTSRGIGYSRQHALPVSYKNFNLECGYRIDLLIEDSVIVELKSVEKLMPVHDAQLISYLKLAQCTVGLLINFNVQILKHGVRRKVLDYAK